MKLWDPTVVPLNGSQSPFGFVLSKQDWLVDSRHYTDTYSALLFGLLIASSAGAAITVALAGATQIDESTHRFRVLSALGTRTTTLRRAQALASLCPPAVSTIIGWLLGSGLGFAYVALCNSSNSGARPTAFPIDRFLEFCAADALFLCLISVPIFWLARRRLGSAPGVAPVSAL
jgi:predicted lysophospholipase L1 biosynthesis ABC-type transport system permease subunit